MGRNMIHLLVLLVLMLSEGCSSSGHSAKTAKAYHPDGITLAYEAEPLLNIYDGRSHTLHLVVYQLDSPNGFRKLSGNADGLAVLLSASAFDQSVLNVSTYSIEPASADTIAIGRAENALWVGIAAGYNAMQPDDATRCYRIPQQHIRGVPLVSKSKDVPEPLDIRIRFTSNSIRENPPAHEH